MTNAQRIRIVVLIAGGAAAVWLIMWWPTSIWNASIPSDLALTSAEEELFIRHILLAYPGKVYWSDIVERNIPQLKELFPGYRFFETRHSVPGGASYPSRLHVRVVAMEIGGKGICVVSDSLVFERYWRSFLAEHGVHIHDKEEAVRLFEAAFAVAEAVATEPLEVHLADGKWSCANLPHRSPYFSISVDESGIVVSRPFGAWISPICTQPGD